MRGSGVRPEGWSADAGRARYAAAERIAYVGPDGVLLSVTKAQLPTEQGGR